SSGTAQKSPLGGGLLDTFPPRFTVGVISLGGLRHRSGFGELHPHRGEKDAAAQPPRQCVPRDTRPQGPLRGGVSRGRALLSIASHGPACGPPSTRRISPVTKGACSR